MIIGTKKVFILSLAGFLIPLFSLALSGWDNTEKRELIIRDGADAGPVISPFDVKDLDSLGSFCRNIMAGDKNVKLIRITPGVAEIDYQYSGKILGLVPVKAVAKAFVDSDDSVKIQFPWYDPFIKKKPDLRLNDKESDLSKLGLDGLETDIQKQAWSLQLIANILKTRHDKK